MGNTKSHVSKNHRPGEEMYIFRIINRTLNGLRRHREHHQSQNVDHDTERSSKCSECKGYNYQQDSLIFDSDSEMSPNAEEEILVMKSWELQHEKERLRPPTYNAEDYAMALRRWGRRPVPSISDFHGTLPSTASSSSGYVSGNGEMTLRQFTSVSELLNKLRADLRFSFPSFVQEFASAPADGITLLLETLRGVQLVQNTPPSGQNGSRIGTRRAALDELGCVECLSACAERCADVPRLLSQAQPGLLALAVCLTSSLNRSRVLALQLLTKVCQINDGHAAVSEAVSSLRLRYGEGGRFRFLAGALLAPRAAIALRVAGLSFLNAFLNTAPRTQTRLYIQAEACEAGLEPRVLQEWLSGIDDRNDEILAELLKKEVKKWTKNCVDVDTLEKRLAQAEEKCSILSNKVSILQTQIKKLQLEKLNSCNHTNFNINNNNNSKKVSSRSHDNKFKRLSSNGEDEGISSSERSSTPENPCKNRENPSKIQDNDQETTIDDVIEELRILVKDAEEEDRASLEHHNNEGKNFDNAVDKTMKNNVNNDYQDKRNSALKNEDKKSKEAETDHYACVNKISKEECKRGMKKNNSPSSALKAVESDSLKIFVKDAEKLEDEIVPAILYPQPPRRTLPCFSSVLAARHDEFLDHLTPAFNSHNNDDDDAEEETVGDDSDSLLSASKLKYNNKNECFNLEEYKHCFGKNRVEPKGSFKKQRNISKNIHDSTALNHQNFKVQDLRENYKQSKFNGLKKNERQKYNGKTNIVQRSLSQDYMTADSLIYDYQQPGHGIEGRIKKFESLNVFDSSNFNNNLRNDRGELRNGRRQSDDIKLTRKIRRSESCHQVFHEARSINNSDKGGSDSGLHYITEYDSQSITTDFLNSETIEQSNNHFSVSLNEIGTSFNSMVDIVTDNSAIKNKLASERIQSKNRNAPIYSTKKYTDKVTDDNHHSHLKSDNFHTEIYSSSRVKNDKSYREKYSHRNQNQHIYRNHFMNDFNSSNNLPVSSSMNCEKSKSKKFSFIDPVMYLPSSGRPHDAFNIGKNRCNAGKYSGNPPLTSNRGIKKNTSSASCPKRGKVTDILSGLY